MKNSNLHAAKKAKNDEFYTMLTDIEKELKYYKDQFKDKVVYCNCDNPQRSEFVRFFRLKFCDWGLKKLIATCITEDNSNGWGYVWDKDINGNGIMDEEEVTMIPLQQNGDFRSPECIEFLKEADIVVTNPPFSLYRSYLKQLMDYNKKFLHIGNKNAFTYKEVFPYIKEGKLRTGRCIPQEFRLPDGTLSKQIAGLCRWFTNLKTHKADDPMELVEKFDPINKHLHYDNYDAYNVDKVADIPYNTDEVLGCPITIIDRIADDGYIHFTHNEEEMKFEIVAFRKGEDGQDLVFTREREFNLTLVSLFDEHSRDDKKRRRESEWENYLRTSNNKENIKPIDYFFPNTTNRSAGSMNGVVKGKETYRRILIQKL